MDRTPLRAWLYDGDILLIYLMWYSAERVWLETFRVQNWIILGADRHLAGRHHLHRRRRLPLAAASSRLGVPGAWIKEKEAQEAAAAAEATVPSPPAEPTTEPSAG